MRILSFDTSETKVQIACLENNKVYFEQKLEPKESTRQESASVLLPAIDAALKKISWQKQELDLLVVGIGPGSFTGLRVAVMTARTMAYALKLPLVPISYFEALASRLTPPVALVKKAGNNKYFAAAYVATPEIPLYQEIMPFCGSLEEIINSLTKKNYLLLADQESYLDLIKKDIECKLLTDPNNLAVDSALLAFNKICKSRHVDQKQIDKIQLMEIYPWKSVYPLYLREPSITLKSPLKSVH